MSYLNSIGSSVALALVCIYTLAACAPAEFDAIPTEQYYSVSEFESVNKIDAHVHVNTKDAGFIDQAKRDGFKLISINVDYPDFPDLETQRDVSRYWLGVEPSRFQFVSTFSMVGWAEGTWQQAVIDHIDRSVSEGAIGVKVWKNVGMEFRDQDNELVMLDHKRLDPIFNYLEVIGLPFVGHQGEPKNCWLPVEKMTVNNDKQYFSEHPQYHMYKHPELPSYENQINARNNRLDRHPNIKFMGAHMASLEWSVTALAEFLDTYPDAVVDLAARMGQVQFQSGEDKELVRAFFIKYQDRILYASDLTSSSDVGQTEFSESVHKRWKDDWRYLATNDRLEVPEVDHEVIGLNLPKAVIDKVYYSNAVRFFSIYQ